MTEHKEITDKLTTIEKMDTTMEKSEKSEVTKTQTYDVVFSFDTTGSMYPCIREVRRNVEEIVKRLFEEIPGLRVGIIAHGDYCDINSSYLMKMVDLTTDRDKIITFIKDVENTGGGDYPEAYEYVLRESQKMSWKSDTMRSIVLIGDAYPHEKDENPYKIDWRTEAKELMGMGVNVYSIQCLDMGRNPQSYTFYKQLAAITNGYHMKLDQFSYIRDLILAVCFSQVSNEKVSEYEQEVKTRLGGLTKGMRHIFDTMLGRESASGPVESDLPEEDSYSSSTTVVRRTRRTAPRASSVVDLPASTEVTPCNPAKFQVLDVDEDCSIKEFVEKMGLPFKRGRGFYEFTKPETIQQNKEIILMKKDSGDLYEGSGARTLANLISYDEKKKIKPTDIDEYRVFIQSTSYNRRLIKDTKFLYEVDDSI